MKVIHSSVVIMYIYCIVIDKIWWEIQTDIKDQYDSDLDPAAITV